MCRWKQWVELSKAVKLIINIMGIRLTNIHSENKYKHSTLPHEESLLAILATKSVIMIGDEWDDSSCSNRHHQQSNRRRHCQKTHRCRTTDCLQNIVHWPSTPSVCTSCRRNLARYSVMILRWTDGTLLWGGQIPWGRKTGQLQGKARLMEISINA